MQRFLICQCSINLSIPDIFIKNDRYKLGDFGLAKSLANPQNVEEGDQRYMAKELLDHCDDLSKADIFSLGLTVYSLLSGVELPRDGPLWHDLRSGRVPEPLECLQDVVVGSMMEPDYQKRPSATELLRMDTFEAT